jgi:uncharacterized membrane protein YkvA (DUF1232 family)
MNDDQKFEKMIDGKEEHYSDKKFLSKLKSNGTGLGYKALKAAATLYVALKSPDMSKANKLILAGALGYFILPFDVIADFLPMVGLTDDIFVIVTALSKVYFAITDEMKEEASQLIDKKFGKEQVEELKEQ